LRPAPAKIAAELSGERAGEESPGTVATKAEEREAGTEEKDLRGNVAARGIDELGKKGQEEESGLGIEKIDKDALGEDAVEAVGVIGGDDFGRVAAEKSAEAEEYEIGGAKIFNDIEGAGGGGEKSGESEDGGGYMEKSSDGDASGGNDSSEAAVTNGAAEDVEDSRTGDDQEDHGAGQEEEE